MRKISKRIRLERAVYWKWLSGRMTFRIRHAFAAIGLTLIASTTAFSQADNAPVPRPSPLAPAGIGGPGDEIVPDPFLDPVPAGLSPGALIDPTADVEPFSRLDLEAGAAPDATDSPGTPLQLGPEAPDSAGVPFQLNPDAATAAGDPLQLVPEAEASASAPRQVSPNFGTAAGQPLGSNPLLGAQPPTATQVPYVLSAQLEAEGPVLASGITWRIFEAHPGPDEKLPLIGEAGGGAIEIRLSPGEYLVHAAYGRAGATKKISVGPAGGNDTMVINAGALKLSVLVGEDQPLAADEVSFDVYAPDEDGSSERVLVVSDAPPDQIIGLNAAIYHIICRYGDANAIVRADLRVEPGKLTEATIYQNAARLTLKLVSAHGGEALANTSWAILTDAGDSVVESVGAFPSVVLAAGEYTAIASHEGRNYEHKFAVESGRNRDVEVIANKS